MPEKRKLSFEANEAIGRNLAKAQAANRRKHVANREAREAQAERERKAALASAADTERRGGALVGDRVRGRNIDWIDPATRGTFFEGTVTDTVPFERGGVPVLCDDGKVRHLNFYDVRDSVARNAAEASA